jgi:L-aspartate semialdehyde sulfurtransferase ferredoxin
MKKRVKLIFPQHLIKEPILFNLAKTYDIMPNIRRARVTDAVAEIVLEFDGAEENIDKAIEKLREDGVEVDIQDAKGD